MPMMPGAPQGMPPMGAGGPGPGPPAGPTQGMPPGQPQQQQSPLSHLPREQLEMVTMNLIQEVEQLRQMVGPQMGQTPPMGAGAPPPSPMGGGPPPMSGPMR